MVREVSSFKQDPVPINSKMIPSYSWANDQEGNQDIYIVCLVFYKMFQKIISPTRSKFNPGKSFTKNQNSPDYFPLLLQNNSKVHNYFFIPQA